MRSFARGVTLACVTLALVASPVGAASLPTKSNRGVVLQQSGTRSSTTKAFVVPETWTLEWSFNCAKSPLGEGSFVVTVHPVAGTNVGAAEGQKIDESGPSGSGRQVYDTGGRKTLVIVALCPWKLKVLKGST